MSSTYGSIIITSVNLLSAIIATPIVEYVGRKVLLILGYLMCCASLLTLVVIYIISNEMPNKVVLIIASVIFLLGYEIGPGPCFYICCAEIFPKKVHDKCTAISYSVL